MRKSCGWCGSRVVEIEGEPFCSRRGCFDSNGETIKEVDDFLLLLEIAALIPFALAGLAWEKARKLFRGIRWTQD